MATHSSNLAWKIPWMQEPGRYSPWGRKKLDLTEGLSRHLRFYAVSTVVVPNLSGSREWFCGRWFFHGPKRCKQWGAAVNTDEASLTHLPLTPCCEARFLTGPRWVPVHGDPCSRAGVSSLFGTRDPFRGRQFFHQLGWGMVSRILHLSCTFFFLIT